MKRIIYHDPELNKVLLMTPTEECLSKGYTIYDIGVKDVPEGTPFWIVEDEDLPATKDQERWELDNPPEPDGYGGETNDFQTGPYAFGENHVEG